jgi:hypothetical protein
MGGGQLAEAGIGVVSLKGGLRFGSQGEALAFKGLSLDTRSRLMRAAMGKAALNLAALSPPSSTRDGFSIRVAVHSLRLSGSFAALLNRSFRLSGVFRRGEPFGEVSVDATLRSVKAKGGAIELSLDPAFAAKLATLGATVAPFESTAQPGPSLFSLPDIHGAIGRDLSAGSLQTENGLRFFPNPQPGASELQAVQFSVDLASDLISARLRIDLPTTTETGPLATVDFSSARVTPSGEGFTVSPQLALLSDFAARQLNAALLGDADAAYFAGGEPFASVGLAVHPG